MSRNFNQYRCFSFLRCEEIGKIKKTPNNDYIVVHIVFESFTAWISIEIEDHEQSCHNL